ncbi:MAG: TonB-dependent receptor [Bacteroidales bacterium]|nr:TonB-dependent receptor [Bacteroidales bacterium]
MKKNILMLLFLPFMMLQAKTNEQTGKFAENKIKPDSMSINLDEVVINKSMRENSFLNDLPVSYSVLSGKQLEVQQAQNLRALSVYIPNLYVPDYGSKITSAVYIRGIGSRLNTSAIGFYVDNISYLDKSAFDFELQDIQRVDVLRGPQGTLYGRNSMGGLIHIHTKSPFVDPGNSVRLSYGSYNDLKVELSHAQVFNSNLAFSVSANYNTRDGFEKNTFTGEDCGDLESGGALTKWAARFSNGWKADLSVNYEYSMQNGYPYAPYSENKSVVSYDGTSSYKRHLLSAGLSLEKPLEKAVFSSMTGYQFIDDDLKLDQDFSPESIFSLNQKQNQHAFTQEFVLKSKEEKPYEWVMGAFGFYKNLDTDTPVAFKEDGVTNLLEGNIVKNLPPFMSFDITDKEVLIPGLFTENNYSAAIYHQSTYHFQKLKGLSATAGLRIDYEYASLDYSSSANMHFNYDITYMNRSIGDEITTNALLEGLESKDFWQVVPKVSLQYDFNAKNKVYASFSKGYQAGGYNIQLFSDLIQAELKAAMTEQMKESVTAKLQPYMSPATVGRIAGNIPVSKHVSNVKDVIGYDPEYSWNYELGFHTEPVEGKLQVDAALFYIDCYNRQIAQFSPNGFGRMMKNASGSYSKGFEISVLSKPIGHLVLNAAYGFTDARFTDYKDSVKVNGLESEVDYSGKHVPMIPEHTLSLGADYSWIVRNGFLDKVILGAQYTAASSICWTEDNDLSQGYYGVTNGQVSFLKSNLRLDLWIKNAFDQYYNTFYFESLGHAFAQKGRPRQIGLTVQYLF